MGMYAFSDDPLMKRSGSEDHMGRTSASSFSERIPDPGERRSADGKDAGADGDDFSMTHVPKLRTVDGIHGVGNPRFRMSGFQYIRGFVTLCLLATCWNRSLPCQTSESVFTSTVAQL